MIRLRVIHGIFALLLCQSVHSEEQYKALIDLTLEELLQVSIASTNPETIFSSVSTVSVITAEQIKQYGFRTIADAVSTIAGFDVLRTYLKRSLATVRGILQDHYANKVLVMINGVPSWHAVTGEGNLERINIHQVKRIEVLKGPASVLYGTNAYAGAINIVLHQGSNGQSGLITGIGSESQYTVGGSYYATGQNEGDYWSVSAYQEENNRQNYQFIDETGIAAPIEDFLSSRNITLQAKMGNHQLLFNGYKNQEGYLGVVPRFSGGAGNPHQPEGYLAAYKYRHTFANQSTLRFNTEYDWNRRVFSRSADNSIQADAWGYHYTVEVKYNFALSEAYDIELGADYVYRKAQDYVNFNAVTDTSITHNNMQGRDVSSQSLFAQLGYHKNDFKWLLGIRNVDNELFGKNNSFRASLVYQPSETSSIKLIAGQSYRSPSLFELYFRTDSLTVFGNPGLHPEESTSFELAYLNAFGSFFIQANLYRARYENKIFRVKGDVTLPDGSTITDTNVYANGDDFSSTGVELELGYSNAEIFDGFFNVSFIDGDRGDQQTGTDHYNFKYVPDYTVSAGISKSLGHLTLSAVVSYRGNTAGPEQSIDSSLITDLSFSYQHILSGIELNHRLHFENTFDKPSFVAEYVRRRGLNQVPLKVGRAITYTLSFTF